MSTANRILLCDNVWKVYGPNADTYLSDREHPPSPEDLAAAGLLAAVRGVSLSINRGEIFVIMGLSGSGKSTLLRCMTRLVEPTAGSILLGGTNLLNSTERQLMQIRREKMGMVFQNYALMPHLTALENVAFPLKVQGMKRTAREARALQMLELVGLGGRGHHYPRELSGGQQQRVGIARSLTLEPDIWFLDEPFSALDPLVRREMQDEFLRLQTLLRKTIVFVTHDFAEAVRLADRIAIMREGAVVQVATPEELVLAPADPYVSAFTRDIPRAQVVTARSAIDLGAETAAGGGSVPAGARIIDIAEQVLGAGGPVAVLDEDGAILGALSRDAVIRLLLAQPHTRAALAQ
ncbi:glycine betaine/L-proline ABC transporter ATP-binding protein [Ancylobacter sp. TS-1]|uniref:quaternary amine ABC transporter ATP-binding protein n=1 Tax=Ancylobacter sp. TS-1 TaxID=1850374 RepID=UPI001FEDAA8F|nr:ATP-binding cassette domain-containing protein [Ancylobacter sp. TS-1]